MAKSFTLIQTVATAGLFSAVSFWYIANPNSTNFLFHSRFLLINRLLLRYGFMFGRETSRKELGDLIADLRRGNPDSSSSNPPHS
ncbi:hypothetical protein SSX86_012164 [Deinandra increscens subsp. villosa]|uniref:Uncharacterized protein n=1 Tax=Deinandra increscens subsp. villosa TaxID=3103831 RepID=A0AAP0GYI6_9ASTR